METFNIFKLVDCRHVLGQNGSLGVRIRERDNATLHKISDDPKATGKAILHGMSSYFREGLADIAEQHRQGDYLGAGRTIGKVGLDAYLVTTGVYSLGIQALDLAVGASKVVSNVAKVAGRSALGACGRTP